MEQLIDNLIDTPIGLYLTAFSGILGGLVAIASIIVPFTATPSDDEALAKVKAFIARFSVLKPKA